MTVVAFRDGVMASDSLWLCGEVQILRRTKIVRLASGALFGSGGDVDTRDIIRLLDECHNAKDLPSFGALSSIGSRIGGLLVFLSGEGWMVDTAGDDKTRVSGVYPAWNGRRGYSAVGAGSQMALIAMDAGATAVEAIRLVCARNTCCGLPVHSLNLKV